jgi:hypothetical protein
MASAHLDSGLVIGTHISMLWRIAGTTDLFVTFVAMVVLGLCQAHDTANVPRFCCNWTGAVPGRRSVGRHVRHAYRRAPHACFE